MIGEVDSVLARVQRESWVSSVPAGDGLVNLSNKRFEAVRSLEVERDNPVRCEWRIRLEGPEESDHEFSDISVILPSDPSKRKERLCGGTAYESCLFCHPIVFLDHIASVIHHIGL